MPAFRMSWLLLMGLLAVLPGNGVFAHSLTAKQETAVTGGAETAVTGGAETAVIGGAETAALAAAAAAATTTTAADGDLQQQQQTVTTTTTTTVQKKSTVYKQKRWSDAVATGNDGSGAAAAAAFGAADTCQRHGYNVDGLFVVPEFARLLQSLNRKQAQLAARIAYPRDYGLSVRPDSAYDVIVVGCGAAGSVLAAKLSDVKDLSVLVLEAGGRPHAQSEIPGLWANSIGTDMDWQYSAAADDTFGQSLDGRRVRVVRGKCLGGTTALNRMMYDRGTEADYAKFHAAGLTKWGWKDVLRYYMRSEDCRFEKITTDTTVRKRHRVGGKLCVDSFRNTRTVEIREVYTRALNAVDYGTVDFMDVKHHKGFVSSVATVKDGLRVNAARAFLRDADRKYNLKLAARSTVRRVVFENGRAVGVEYENPVGELVRARCKHYVALCAGPVGSPQILQQSGVGPRAAVLEPLGVPAVVDNANVGQRLQAHPAFLGVVVRFAGQPIRAHSVSDMVFEYLSTQTGPLATIGLSSFIGFVDVDGNGEPDVQISFYYYSEDDTVFMPSQLDALNLDDNVTAQIIDLNDGGDVQIVGISLLRPANTGRVTVDRTAAGDYEPRVQYGSLHPRDVDTLLKAVEWVKTVARSEAFARYGPEVVPLRYAGGPEPDADSADYWRHAIRHMTTMNVQMAGTCSMAATQATGVVDQDLDVFGVAGLKVVDSSVLPFLFSAESSAPTMMVAEKAADIIKEKLGFLDADDDDDDPELSEELE